MDQNSEELGNRRKDQNLGGFPGPFQLFRLFLQKFAPRVYDHAHRWFTVLPGYTGTGGTEAGKSMKWLSQNLSGLMVGRNGDFNTDELTDDQLEELGGLEYRALRALSYIVMIVSAVHPSPFFRRF